MGIRVWWTADMDHSSVFLNVHIFFFKQINILFFKKKKKIKSSVFEMEKESMQNNPTHWYKSIHLLGYI